MQVWTQVIKKKKSWSGEKMWTMEVAQATILFWFAKGVIQDIFWQKGYINSLKKGLSGIFCIDSCKLDEGEIRWRKYGTGSGHYLIQYLILDILILDISVPEYQKGHDVYVGGEWKWPSYSCHFQFRKLLEVEEGRRNSSGI